MNSTANGESGALLPMVIGRNIGTVHGIDPLMANPLVTYNAITQVSRTLKLLMLC